MRITFRPDDTVHFGSAAIKASYGRRPSSRSEVVGLLDGRRGSSNRLGTDKTVPSSVVTAVRQARSDWTSELSAPNKFFVVIPAVVCVKPIDLIRYGVRYVRDADVSAALRGLLAVSAKCMQTANSWNALQCGRFSFRRPRLV